MLMVFFFFLPPIHLSQQLSFILISFYLNLQHRAWDKEEAESLNNQHGDLEVLGAVPGAVGSDPKGHSITPQDHLLQVKLFAGNLGTSHAPVSVFHLPHVPGVCDISQSGIPPPPVLLLSTLRCGCPLRALGLLCFSSRPFKALTAFLPFWISCDRSAAAFRSCGRHVAGWRRMETLCKVAELNVQLHSLERLV